jgi:acyl-CoA synthetase (AMP-forming)/AMP-acid ligase II
VEHALELRSAVREAAVVGVHDDRWGEVPRAFVALVEGAEADEAELIAWVRERLAAFKSPRSVVVLDELRRVGTGKVDKHSLRERP